MAARQPNILFIQADQMAAPSLPFHGGPTVKAPNLAKLAAEGQVFEAAYCNSPLCAPSRFSMLSGQLASAIGAYDNAADFPAEIPTFAHHLRLAGYRTILAGKMHFVGPDQKHGFEERLTSDIYPADYGWTPSWDQPDRRQDYFHTMASVEEAGPYARTMQLDFDDEVAYQARRKLYDLARERELDDRPFFLLASFTHPHDPYAIAPEYWDRYADEEIAPPKVAAIPHDEQDPHSKRMQWVYGLDEKQLDPEAVRRARRAYYGAISYIDDKVGELLGTLAAAGLERDTLVIFTGDHGDMLGERGLWYKMTFFEWGTRVPLLVRWPGHIEPGRVSAPVSLVDLFPTLLEAAGPAAPQPLEPLPGRSLFPLMTGKVNGSGEGPSEAIGEYLGEGAAGPLVMIRRGSLKFVVGEDSPPQLFDLASDPDELINLAGDPANKALLEDFQDEARQRWDFAALRGAVLASQRRRRLVFEAHMTGRKTLWDFQPFTDASQTYVRNTLEILEDLERISRLPLPNQPQLTVKGPSASARTS